MSYNKDLTWELLSNALGGNARVLRAALLDAQEGFQRYLVFKDGRSAAVIASALGRTEADVQDLEAAFAALRDVFSYANGGTPANGDKLAALRKFL